MAATGPGPLRELPFALDLVGPLNARMSPVSLRPDMATLNRMHDIVSKLSPEADRKAPRVAQNTQCRVLRVV
jgi:hypothetical protein